MNFVRKASESGILEQDGLGSKEWSERVVSGVDFNGHVGEESKSDEEDSGQARP